MPADDPNDPNYFVEAPGATVDDPSAGSPTGPTVDPGSAAPPDDTWLGKLTALGQGIVGDGKALAATVNANMKAIPQLAADTAQHGEDKAAETAQAIAEAQARAETTVGVVAFIVLPLVVLAAIFGVKRL